jgi:hypothetical protein
MKQDGYRVEYVPEYVKKWTYYHRKPEGFDQVYLFGKQMHNEDTALRGGFDCVVCDSPLFLATVYALAYNIPGADELEKLAWHFEKAYPSLNIYVNRGNKPYSHVGRFQNEEEARIIDLQVRGSLRHSGIKFKEFDFSKQDEIYKYVKENLC